MTWTYNTALTLTRDKVRLLVGDTDTNDQKLQDEEIVFLATLHGGVMYVASSAAEAIAAKYAAKVDRSVGDLRLSSSQKQEQYLALAKRLRSQAALVDWTPWMGGISKDDKDTYEEDTDRTAPAFTRDRFRVPGEFHGGSAIDDDEST